MTLADFLLARIAEDEEFWTSGAGRFARDCQECAALSDHEPNRPTVNRMLAECEAKLRIVGLHVASNDPTWDPMCSEEAYLAKPDDCEELQILAAVYADHPDYRDEWRL